MPSSKPILLSTNDVYNMRQVFAYVQDFYNIEPDLINCLELFRDFANTAHKKTDLRDFNPHGVYYLEALDLYDNIKEELPKSAHINTRWLRYKINKM